MRNFIATLAVLLAMTTLSSKASAQMPYQEPFEGRWTPFIEPDYFNPDYQFFAPAEIDEYGGYPEPNIGFFFSYERLYWNVGRSQYLVPEFEPPQGDFTWGNRIEFGFNDSDGHDYGWLFSIVHLDGPNQFFVRDVTPLPLPAPPNRVILTEPINVGGLSSVEIARTWRLERNYHGGFIELLGGIRYTQFKSENRTTIDVVLDTIPPPPIPGTFTFVTEQIVENNMLGGEIGVRWFREKGRYNLSADVKFIPCINWQIHKGDTRDPGDNFGPLDPDKDEFVPLGELRLAATYNVTRDIAIGSGFNLLYFGKGIGRAWNNPTLPPPDVLNNEDLVITGVSILVTLNR